MPSRDQFFKDNNRWHQEFREECKDLSKFACFKALQIEILRINQIAIRSQIDEPHLDDLIMHTIKARILSEVYEEKLEQSESLKANLSS